MKVWAAALGLALWAGQAQRQEPAPIERQEPRLPQAPPLRAETRLVNVALNVTDEHGAAVAGLTVDDFVLNEDGKPQKITYFEKESVTPLQIVLAVDTSESTYAESRLERDAAKSFVKSLLREQDAISVLSFADDVTEVVPFTNDARRVDSGFGRMPRGEATALYDAIYLASQRLEEAPAKPGARRVIVLITDGENTVHRGSYPAALEEAERAGAMVYSLIVIPVEADAGRNTGGEHALIQMARDTGGKFYEIYQKKDVADAFEHVSDDLRTQYTLGYYAPHKGLGDSGLRRIQVEMKDPALRGRYTLRHRTAYYAR